LLYTKETNKMILQKGQSIQIQPMVKLYIDNFEMHIEDNGDVEIYVIASEVHENGTASPERIYSQKSIQKIIEDAKATV